MILLVLGWRPLLVGQAWKSFSSQPMVTDDINGLIGPIKSEHSNFCFSDSKKKGGIVTFKKDFHFNRFENCIMGLFGLNLLLLKLKTETENTVAK